MSSRLELVVFAPLLTFFGCRAGAGEPTSAVADPVRAELSRMIAEREAPGVQYVFLDEHGVTYSAQAGKADVEHGSAVGPETLFHGYSVTKTFTAAAIVKLAAEKRLDLDDPITRHLPELGDAKTPTLRQVLSHTAGYANPIPIGWAHLASADATFDSDAFVTRMLREYGTPERAAGEKLAYSNLGYLFLGEVVHRVSGRPYTRYVEDELIAPLGLSSGEVLTFTMREPTAHARGYISRWSGLNASLGLFIDRGTFIAGTHDGWTQFKDMQVDGAAYGGLLGNAAGFARYLQALLRHEPPFTAEVTDALFTPQKTARGEALPMALSWFEGEVGGEPYFDHAGGGGGFYCEIRLYPKRRRASVIMFNRTGIKNDHLLDRVDPLLLSPAPLAAR